MSALYSHTTRSTGTTLTAAIYNGDHQNHIDNGIPAQLDDYSSNATQMQSTVDPGEASSESLATSLAGELERLRFAIKETKDAFGTAVEQWYSTPATGSVWSTGDVKMTYKTTADTGWVLMNDGTIGSAASGATTRANADTATLYALLWNNTADAQCAVSTGRGANAAADFAANKTLALPKSLGRALAVYGSGSGLTARALALANGAETKTIVAGNLPASGLSVPSLSVTATGSGNVLANTNTAGGGGGLTKVQAGIDAASGPNDVTVTSAAASISVSGSTGTGTTGNMGSGTAMDVMNPMQFLNVMIKL
jgi:hypothetical protein